MSNPQQVWEALQQRSRDRRQLMWLSSFDMVQLTEQQLTLKSRPGQRQAAGFATPNRLSLLEAELAAITGKRIKVHISQPATQAPQAGSTTAADHSSARPDPQRAAMDLPLVRKVFEVFPDATILNVEDSTPAKDEN